LRIAARTFTHSGSTAGVSMAHFLGVYRSPAYRRGGAVYTNQPPFRRVRGYGIPEACHLLEQLMDMAAEKIGMDPLESGEKPEKLGDLSQMGFPGDRDPGEMHPGRPRKIGWSEKRKERRKTQQAVRNRYGEPLRCQRRQPLKSRIETSISANEDGSATVSTGGSEHGQTS